MTQELELVDVLASIVRSYQKGTITDDDLMDMILFLLAVREDDISYNEKKQTH